MIFILNKLIWLSSVGESPGHTMPIWRSRSLWSEKSWTSAWSAHKVVATSYWHLGSLLGRETIGSDRKASTTKFYCKTLSCWSWLWLRSIHGSISVVCGIGNVVGLSYPAWGHSGQRVGIRGQLTDGLEDRTNITIASCLIGVILRFNMFQDVHIYMCK